MVTVDKKQEYAYFNLNLFFFYIKALICITVNPLPFYRELLVNKMSS